MCLYVRFENSKIGNRRTSKKFSNVKFEIRKEKRLMIGIRKRYKRSIIGNTRIAEIFADIPQNIRTAKSFDDRKHENNKSFC